MSARTPLALLPGLLLGPDLWRDQIAGLQDLAEITVADFSTQDNVADMARSVLDAMPERFAMAGLSMGGYVAFEVMRQAPERIERLALLDTTARPDTPEAKNRRREMIALSKRGEFKGVTRKLFEVFVHEERGDDPDLLDRLAAMAQAIGRDGFERQQTAIMNRPDSRRDLVAIRCPTLVLCGRQDRLTPLDAHTEMAAAIGDARLHVVERCGHLPPMERPAEATAALRDWLTRQ